MPAIFADFPNDPPGHGYKLIISLTRNIIPAVNSPPQSNPDINPIFFSYKLYQNKMLIFSQYFLFVQVDSRMLSMGKKLVMQQKLFENV